MSDGDGLTEPTQDADLDEQLAGTDVVEVELAQGLGLTEALTIGIGTMIGAGIFVLPGIIIAKTGPAAVLAFVLGGLVALINAMSVAEVATGMPKSGGGYYFISRALGPLWGAVMGWSSWFGLVFASAFYMVGFGEYVTGLTGLPVAGLAVGMTVLLVILNLTGSRAAGQAQNLIVGLLGAVLLLFIARGIPSATPSLLTTDFMRFGIGAVLAGTATLFVTYCGFAEIASMGEEIRDPGRNLPKAIFGSVISVIILYTVAISLCVMLRPLDRLEGTTLVADLAGDMMGSFGRGAIYLGAILATVSSANASIMSASRISFAMGRDSLIWDWLNEVHPRFRVPHRAIVVTGALTVGFILIGRIELLAEVSGFLHLVLYGLISIACIVLRGARMAAYKPAYRVPLFPLIPILAALSSIGISLFMHGTSLLWGLGLMVFAVAQYHFWGRRRTELCGAWPYFLRRGILEQALVKVEQWGAEPDKIPVAVVAVGHPERERARLQIAAAMLGPSRGDILAVNVFTVGADDEPDDDVLQGYYETINRRAEALQRAADLVAGSGATVTSHVPVATSPFYGLMSAAQASNAAMMLLGWPEETGGEAIPAAFLLGSLDRYLRAHVLTLREQGPISAGSILTVVDESRHGDLAILTAARLTNAWGSSLTVGGLVAPEEPPEVMAAVDDELSARVGDLARAEVYALPAADIAEATADADRYDLAIVGVGSACAEDLCSLTDQLEHITGASVLVVRAHEGLPLDQWM